MNINRNPLLMGIAENLQKQNASGAVTRYVDYVVAKREVVLSGEATLESLTDLALAYLDGHRLTRELANIEKDYADQDGVAGHQDEIGNSPASPTACQEVEPTHPAKKVAVRNSAGEVVQVWESHATYTGDHTQEAIASRSTDPTGDDLERILAEATLWDAERGDLTQERLMRAICDSLNGA